MFAVCLVFVVFVIDRQSVGVCVCVLLEIVVLSSWMAPGAAAADFLEKTAEAPKDGHSK